MNEEILAKMLVRKFVANTATTGNEEVFSKYLLKSGMNFIRVVHAVDKLKLSDTAAEEEVFNAVSGILNTTDAVLSKALGLPDSYVRKVHDEFDKVIDDTEGYARAS